VSELRYLASPPPIVETAPDRHSCRATRVGSCARVSPRVRKSTVRRWPDTLTQVYLLQAGGQAHAQNW